MRHRLVARLGIVAAIGAVLLAAGCGTPGGVDGDLTDEWGAMMPASGFEPVTGACHLANFNPIGTRAAYEEIDCTERHRTETSYVGTYESPAADADRPPAAGSAGSRAAYKTCDDRTTTYVGGPWRNARLWIGVVNPTAAAWNGGARWFRCEVLELTSVEDDGGLVQRTGTLRNALAEATGSLMLGCYAIQLESSGAISSMPPVDCTAKHNGEFAGVWFATDLDYPKNDATWAKFHDGCRNLIAEFANVPNDADLQYRTGVVSLPGGEDVWAQGDRGVRCYLWLDGAGLTTTLRGQGTASLPVQYK